MKDWKKELDYKYDQHEIWKDVPESAYLEIIDFIEQIISERDKEWKTKLQKIGCLYGYPKCSNLGHDERTFHGLDVKCPVEKEIEELLTLN